MQGEVRVEGDHAGGLEEEDHLHPEEVRLAQVLSHPGEALPGLVRRQPQPRLGLLPGGHQAGQVVAAAAAADVDAAAPDAAGLLLPLGVRQRWQAGPPASASASLQRMLGIPWDIYIFFNSTQLELHVVHIFTCALLTSIIDP